MTRSKYFFQLSDSTRATDEIDVASVRNDNYSIIKKSFILRLTTYTMDHLWGLAVPAGRASQSEPH